MKKRVLFLVLAGVLILGLAGQGVIFAQAMGEKLQEPSKWGNAGIKEVIEEYERLDKVPDGKGGYQEFKQKLKRVKAIAFVDKKGKVKKQIELKEVHGEKLFGEKYQKIYPVFTKNKKYVAIAKIESTKNPIDIHRKTGLPRTDKVRITFYDEKGDILFRKDNVRYKPVVISENGKRMVCVIWSPAILQVDVQGSPPKAKLYVLSETGKILFEKEEAFIYPEIRISSSGEWVLYKYEPHMKAKLLKVVNGEEVSFSRAKIRGCYITVMDDGGLLLRKSRGRDSKGRRRFKVDIYYPKEDILKDLGEEFE